MADAVDGERLDLERLNECQTLEKLVHRTEAAGEDDERRSVLDEHDLPNKKIAEAAPQWPTEKLNKIDLAILRLATHELQDTKTPPKVVIDEAVELAKEFGSESSPSFVNGVLGTILKEIEKNDEEKDND